MTTDIPRIEEYQLHPLGWENDPEEERFRLSALDYLSARTYNNYALYFKLEDHHDKTKIISVLKEGLERTVSQTRHLVGTIEKDPDNNNNNHSFVKRKNSTVKFIVQHLDSPGKSSIHFPSFEDLEKAHFTGTALGGTETINLLSNNPMTYGEKPEADPDTNPIVSSVEANFIKGGLILITHMHHYANDITGWASFGQQLAGNCSAIVNGSVEFPPWDPACLDRSRFTTPSKEIITDDMEAASLVDVPPQADRHPDHRPSQSLIFHLSKSKAAVLKAMATPPLSEDTSSNAKWISTYDAAIALTWRVLTRIRFPLYNSNSNTPQEEIYPLWAEGINLAKRLTNPPLPVTPQKQQGNSFIGILSSSMTPYTPPLNLLSIIGTDNPQTPLWKIANYIRQITNLATNNPGAEKLLSQTLEMISLVNKNKKNLSVKVDSFPPLSMAVTDWRDAGCVLSFESDFGDFKSRSGGGGGGLGVPRAFRHLFGGVVTEGLVIVYPPRPRPRRGAGNGGGEEEDDEGIELQFTFEKELLGELLVDEEWGRFFEFRGVDADP